MGEGGSSGRSGVAFLDAMRKYISDAGSPAARPSPVAQPLIVPPKLSTLRETASRPRSLLVAWPTRIAP
jgi:hypothetical protein